jgi:DNA-binding NtrC family response regulator
VKTSLHPASLPASNENSSLKLLVRNAKGEAERGAIAHALEQTHWNRKAAARLLNVSYRALLYKIQEYHLAPPAESARIFSTDDARQAK